MTAETLYHYTDARGLLGIFETKALWCTHISYLNDSLEFKHGYDLYLDMLKKMSANENEEKLNRLAAEKTLEILGRSAYINNLLEDPYRYYVASFSEVPDDLSQWRGYGDIGPKFAIAVSVEELQKLRKQNGMGLEKVSYEQKGADSWLRADFIAGITQLLDQNRIPENLAAEPLQIRPSDLHDMSKRLIEQKCPLLKDASFHAEKEWRLYSNPSDMRGRTIPRPKFRPGRSYLIPYIEVDLKDLDRPILEIWVGPTPHPDEARLAVKRMLAFCKDVGSFVRDQKAVKVSEIPYRTW
jgi:hypothetical protein